MRHRANGNTTGKSKRKAITLSKIYIVKHWMGLFVFRFYNHAFIAVKRKLYY